MRPKIKSIIKKKQKAQTEGPVFDLSGSSKSATAAAESPVTFGLAEPDRDAFTVSVRNAEPLIRRLDTEKKHAAWLGDVQVNLSSAAIMLVLFGLLFMAADEPVLILFAVPGFLVYMLFATLGSFDDEKVKRIRMYVAAAAAIALIAVLVIFRKYIGNGWAIIMDHLYDNAEMAQAYVYDRFHIGATGEDHPYRSMHFAAVWTSCLAGLLTSMPPARFRRPIAMIIAVFAMLAFAYYGVVPAWACIAVLAAGIMLLLSRGSIVSSLTVLLAMVIVFGAVTLIDPGEMYGISRINETIRDKFALSSSFLDGGDAGLDDLEDLQDQTQEQKERERNQGSEFIAEHRWVVVIAVIAGLLAAVGVSVWFVMRKLRSRQKANRAGIDSSDPREAIVAMFPYTVKWLQPAGIELKGKPFEKLKPVIRADVSAQYADRYSEMYELWKEAAYSDHEMTETGRSSMKSFMTDTMDMVREKSDFRSRLVNTFKYAL